MDIKIEVDDKGMQKMLRELSERMEDLTPVMRRIGELLVSSVQENFNREGRYSEPGSWRGGPKRWQELAPSTIRQRERQGYWPGQILTRTGRLKSSINYHAGKDHVVVGTNLIYAAIHQFGGKAGRGHRANIPARPFLVVQDEDLEEIREIIRDYIARLLK